MKRFLIVGLLKDVTANFRQLFGIAEHIFQATNVERVITDVRDAFGNDDGGQIQTICESTFPDARYAIGNTDGSEVIAAIERTIR